ncbi:hypothetical protein NIES2119_09870 [[Phormidium ambiguum] IAM M-71]|uniref:Tyr recombinase domain-containing protein n=1 Tax=[Phormidium ambiguum] IAM M-71 TaxID=454136 RepID=A0A1U7IMC3_9CYAN|nr:site-specific integrase [Phormidium ambiguum]OKH38334.1 hypothetical protein NIES2119_09870 [Phormidium ambiguum IAM M-71]
MRNPRGSVTVTSKRGMLLLRFPRFLFNGEQKYLHLGLPDTPINRQAANMKAQAIAADIAFEKFDYSLEKYQPNYSPKYPQLSELWSQYTEAKSKVLSQTTIQKDFIRVANHIKKLPTDNFNQARKIRDYLLNNYSAETTSKMLMYFGACCNWAINEGIISTNPFEKLSVDKKPYNANIQPFTKAEVDLIIEAFANSRYYNHYTNFVRFLFLTGCRTSEAVGLTWGKVSLNLEKVVFSEAIVNGNRKGTKTGKTRIFPVNDQLRSLLLEIRPNQYKTEQLIFTSPEGMAIDAHNFLMRAWKKTFDELPIAYRKQYNTRHTFITHCLESGVPVAQVASWVGNSPKTIWQHYAGVINSVEVPKI